MSKSIKQTLIEKRNLRDSQRHAFPMGAVSYSKGLTGSWGQKS